MANAPLKPCAAAPGQLISLHATFAALATTAFLWILCALILPMSHRCYSSDG